MVKSCGTIRKRLGVAPHQILLFLDQLNMFSEWGNDGGCGIQKIVRRRDRRCKNRMPKKYIRKPNCEIIQGVSVRLFVWGVFRQRFSYDLVDIYFCFFASFFPVNIIHVQLFVYVGG